MLKHKGFGMTSVLSNDFSRRNFMSKSTSFSRWSFKDELNQILLILFSVGIAAFVVSILVCRKCDLSL